MARPIGLGTVEQVHAYGVVAPAYNRLEDFLIFLFDIYFPNPWGVDNGPGVVCARMLNNRQRVDLLKVFVQHEVCDQEIKARTLEALAVFEICTENRNILAHGRRDAAGFHADLFTIRKMASSNPLKEIYFDIPLSDLRDTANDMIVALDFFFSLCKFMLVYQISIHSLDDLPEGERQVSLPEKPRLPRKLNPRPRSEDRSIARSQLQPSYPSPQSGDQA